MLPRSRVRAPSLLLLALLGAAACGDDGGGEPDASPTGPATVRVDRYAFELDLEPQTSVSTLTLHLETAGNCVTLPSRAPMLDLATVTLGGQPATATADGASFTACGAGWAAGTDLELVVRAMQPLQSLSSSQVGFSITVDGAGGRVFYLISWVRGCDRFGPCDPTPSLFAHYTFTVHHPTGTRALCPGVVTAGATTTTCTFDYDGGPTYSTFGVIASPSWTVSERGSWGGVTATLYHRAGDGIEPLIDDANHAGFVTWMQDHFGPYPYGTTLRVATAPTYWSGFEHPGNIVLDDGLDRPMSSLYARPVTHVLNHEIAHQWAGDQTTLADTYDFVWKEAMAEYLSYAYEVEVEPANALITARAWKAFAQGAGYYPVPEDRPELFTYYGEVYGPGPMILFRQLESLSSRAAVLDALAMLLGRERALSVDDVQAALETTTGLDLDTYFDVWIRGSGAPTWPTFRVTFGGTAPNQTVTVTETTPGGVLHGCNFAVAITDGTQTHKVAIVRGVNGMASVTVPTGVTWAATAATLDPDAQCLAFASTAAAAPRHPPGWTPWRGSLAGAP